MAPKERTGVDIFALNVLSLLGGKNMNSMKTRKKLGKEIHLEKFKKPNTNVSITLSSNLQRQIKAKNTYMSANFIITSAKVEFFERQKKNSKANTSVLDDFW